MREKYESLSLATLKDLAKARGLKGISTLRKPELIERMLEEDEKEKASAGSAESKNTEHRQEESAREENRVREPRASYDTSERKNYQERTEYTYKNPAETAQLDSGEKANGILEVLPDARYKVKLDNGHELIAYTNGKMRKHHIRILAGDRVSLELSPYDLSKGRITFRHIEGRPPVQAAGQRRR